MKLTQWLVGLAAVAAALLVWVFASKHRVEPERAQLPVEAARAADVDPGSEDSLPLAVERRRAPETAEAEVDGFRSWVSVSGRLTLPAGDRRKRDFQVHISGGNDFDWAFESTGGAVDALGNFAVGSRFRGEGPPRGASLEVHFDGHGFTRSRELRPEEFTFDEESRTWLATAAVDLNWIVVRGQLLDDLGQPVSACRVVLKRLSSDGRDVECITVRDTGDDGGFELDFVPCGATFEFSIQRRGFVPVHREIALAEGLVHELGVVQLSRGLSISGRVKSSFPPQARVREFDVLLTYPVRDERDSQTGAIRSVEETEFFTEVPVAEDGSFKLTGLTPGNCTFRLRRNRELLGGRHKRKTPPVAVPASDLVLVDDGAIVRMQARDRATGKAIPGHMRVKFKGSWCWPRDGWPVTGDDGPLDLNWDCGVAVEGVALLPGYQDTPISFTTPGDGEILEYAVLFDALPPEDEKR
jgi:hypothetical protein